MRFGGIVLCGGESKRMRLPKATLPFGPELMLQRVVRLLSDVVEPIVVVAAAGQRLPELPAGTIVTHDERESRGPLEGLRAGLMAIAPHVDAAYATSCDTPLLSGAFVERMTAELGEHNAVVPVDGEFYHPLAAVYRTDTVASMEQLLNQEKLRTCDIFESLTTNRVSIQELRGVDSKLLTLMNVNTPAEYLKALELAGCRIELAVKEALEL
ncbi:MAG: molybdenum cofactor guanylyltransferase [Planctomycetes bacterium]|nr:molybdenum cofactor guanylyltransferase [Planctomycetota bacterium]